MHLLIVLFQYNNALQLYKLIIYSLFNYIKSHHSNSNAASNNAV